MACVHGRGIVHEGLGVAAFMLSSVADTDAGRLVVKLDNLGVGRRITGGAGPRSALEEGKRRDAEALAITFAEFTFGAPLEPPPCLFAACSAACSLCFLWRMWQLCCVLWCVLMEWALLCVLMAWCMWPGCLTPLMPFRALGCARLQAVIAMRDVVGTGRFADDVLWGEGCQLVPGVTLSLIRI